MGIVLALAAAVAYGASDFVGGLLSRRASSYLPSRSPPSG